MQPRVLSFRPTERAEESQEAAEELGIALRNVPLVATEPNPSAAVGDALAALRAERVDFAVFSSPTAFRYLQEAVETGLPRLLGRPRVVAIGRRTAQELRAQGLDPEIPSEFSSKGLASYLRNQGVGQKAVVLFRSDRGTPDLVRDLETDGARVRDVALYCLSLVTDADTRRLLRRSLLEEGFQGFAFTSSLTVEAFFRNTEGARSAVRRALADGVVGAIGRPTAAALVRRDVEALRPPNASFRDLLTLLRDRIASPSADR